VTFLRRALDRSAGEVAVSYALLLASVGVTVAVLSERHVRELDELAGLMLLATLLLGLVVGLGWRRLVIGLPPALDRSVVLVLCGAVLLLAATGPVRRSHDLWSYTMYGREVSVHHVDPYTHVPSEFPQDPFLAQVAPRWRSTPSVYGPLFTAYSAVSTRLAGDSERANRLAFQGLAGLAVMAALLVLARRKTDPVALACLGLHPLVVVYAVGGGHNDPLVGLGVLVGVLLCRSRRALAAGVVIGLAALVKIVAALVIPGLVVWLWCHADRSRRRDAVRTAAAFGTVVVAGYALAGGVTALGPLRAASRNVGWASFWSPVARTFSGTPVAAHISTLAVASVLAVAALLVARHRHDHGPEVLVMAILLVYQLCSAYVLIWYLLWVLPLAMLRWRTLTGQALLAYATVILFASSFHPAPDDRLESVLFEHGLALHAFALLTVVVLVGAALRPRPGQRTRTVSRSARMADTSRSPAPTADLSHTTDRSITAPGPIVALGSMTTFDPAAAAACRLAPR